MHLTNYDKLTYKCPWADPGPEKGDAQFPTRHKGQHLLSKFPQRYHFLDDCKVEGKYIIDINEEMQIFSMRQNIYHKYIQRN